MQPVNQHSDLGQNPLNVMLVQSSPQKDGWSCAFRAMAAMTMCLEAVRRGGASSRVYPDFSQLTEASNQLRTWLESQLLATGRPGLQLPAVPTTTEPGSRANRPTHTSRAEVVHEVHWDMELIQNAALTPFEEQLQPFFENLKYLAASPVAAAEVAINTRELPLTMALSSMAYLSAQLSAAGNAAAISELTLRQAVIDMAKAMSELDLMQGSAEGNAAYAKMEILGVEKLASDAITAFTSGNSDGAAALALSAHDSAAKLLRDRVTRIHEFLVKAPASAKIAKAAADAEPVRLAALEVQKRIAHLVPRKRRAWQLPLPR
jgi:hypothetical protein